MTISAGTSEDSGSWPPFPALHSLEGPQGQDWSEEEILWLLVLSAEVPREGNRRPCWLITHNSCDVLLWEMLSRATARPQSSQPHPSH